MATIDAFILDLIATGRQATPDEVAGITAHVAQAPFAIYMTKIPNRLHPLFAQQGVVLPAKMPSLEFHLLKRIYLDSQWPVGTTQDEFMSDLRYALGQPNIQLWTYHYYRQPFAGLLTPSHVQSVTKPQPYIFIAYTPIHACITTAYQASSINAVIDEHYSDLVQHI